MSKSARQIAYEILLKIEVDKAFSNLAIDSAVKMCNPDSTDCAFISRLVYGVVERKITLDYVVSRHLSNPAKKMKPEVLTVLRMGTYQILFMDKVHSGAAVNESVKLVKANKCEFAAGLVNAVLRKISHNDLELGGDLTEIQKFSVAYSVPEELVKFMIHHYGKENAESFFEASLQPKEITVRVNTLKTTTEKLKKLLQDEQVNVFDTYLPDALKIESDRAVYNLECFKNGLFHVEDLSSQLCVAALELFDGARAVDVCAAPGGKSFTAAEYMKNKGVLYSCDVYPQRTELIKQGAQRLGIENIIPLVNDATVFNENLPEMDRVLCDVPCSGLGIIGKKPEIKYKKLDDTKSLLPIQMQILKTSSKYVKHGGRLVYSTCSVNPNENRRICDSFLKENPEFISVKVLPRIERAVDEGDYLTLFPHKNKCDGFFVAAFVRK